MPGPLLLLEFPVFTCPVIECGASFSVLTPPGDDPAKQGKWQTEEPFTFCPFCGRSSHFPVGLDAEIDSAFKGVAPAHND